jgi:membrane-associated phospholipid phosphatase
LLTPVDKTIIGYLLLVTILIVTSSSRINAWPSFVLAHLVAVLVLVALAAASREARSRLYKKMSGSEQFLVFVHGWQPVVTIPSTYMELSYLIPRVHPRDFDVELAMIDHRIFGVHPTVWLERFTFPAVTETLQLVYPLYYILPIVLGVVLWRKGWFEQYYFWVFVIAFGFYLSYVGYFAVPAVGPRYLNEIIEAQTRPLTGIWFYQTVREALDRAERITRDCFPSGHTEMTLLVLYYSWRFHRRTFLALLPIGIGIIVSTVYLRYHYVIDVFAGVLTALVVVVTAERVYCGLGGRYARLQGAAAELP